MPRKTTGCWTCRARKKKCDDGQPSCDACAMRSITCYGYGAKPAWMDGGDEEKEMLRTMKQRAKESYSQRRRARAMRSAGHEAIPAMTASTSTASPGGIKSEGSDSPATLTTTTLSGGSSRDQQLQQQQPHLAHEGQLQDLDHDAYRDQDQHQHQLHQPDGQHDMQLDDQSPPNNDAQRNYPHVPHGPHVLHDHYDSHNNPDRHGLHAFAHNTRNHPEPMEPHMSYTAHPSSYTSHPQHQPLPPQHLCGLLQYEDTPLPAIQEPTKTLPYQRPRSRSPPPPPPPPPPPVPRPTGRSGSDFPYSEKELSHLMYYFDHVFPRLCPFFTYSAGDKGRGWLLSLFLRTKPLCAAAICISACDQAQFVLGPLSDIPERTNHDLEMQHIEIVVDLRNHLAQLSQQTGASRMAVAVEALACVMHLILFELWIPRHGEVNDWVMHLDAAAALLSSVDLTMVNGSSIASDSPMSMSMTMSTPSDNSGGGGISSSSAAHNNGDSIESFFPVEFLSDGELSAFKFFLTQYTYGFVASAVGHELTPRSVESIQRTHAIFHSNQSKIRDMFGLEDWVLTTMLDVAVLKAWKQRERSAGTLSLRELTRRADVLEARISQGLAHMAASGTAAAILALSAEAASSPLASSSPTSDGARRPTRLTRDERSYMVTSAFLHATLLFLHIVVSGFYPNLPEIRRAVLQTIEALEFMRANCDNNIPSWPYCVAGCLALESEYPRIRALYPVPKKGHHPLVLTQWTLAIIERCWQLRAAQANQTEETVDWVTAMNDLGTRLLLV
ncbi:uncharacterized protein SPSK_00709 [Sporothrix schenckii 1099-18]|uniref:Zn(2)-C6 fungal-type domain-containing protein n=2 Tax=Sporothrix schenckii TaxID=29908 RepID=U7PK82_SPOS1|nr:uncharacterized protein SPSK_00709 [Sporothrix schenckii 1099-18]ERS96053.1 hypothetical protein HMPREF1624_07589 [Sporothrix schenckii ATCC 58251]KJR81678.1 hypothetical protein SPSK_00709 [Sporothrix schenckii 1099-18]